MRLFRKLARSAPAPKSSVKRSATKLPKPQAVAVGPAKSQVDAFAPLRAIADLDNEATRQIDEAQALLAQTLDECPAIYVEAAIERLKAARELIRPLVEEQLLAASAKKAE